MSDERVVWCAGMQLMLILVDCGDVLGEVITVISIDRRYRTTLTHAPHAHSAQHISDICTPRIRASEQDSPTRDAAFFDRTKCSRLRFTHRFKCVMHAFSHALVVHSSPSYDSSDVRCDVTMARCIARALASLFALFDSALSASLH